MVSGDCSRGIVVGVMGIPHRTKGLRPISDISLEPCFVIHQALENSHFA